MRGHYHCSSRCGDPGRTTSWSEREEVQRLRYLLPRLLRAIEDMLRHRYRWRTIAELEECQATATALRRTMEELEARRAR
jgi:hypothetical protein